MPDWQSRRHLEDHFAKHGREVGAQTVAEYDSSARALIHRDDVITFSYQDRVTGLTRVGIYDQNASVVTILSDDDRWIINHFRTDRSYLEQLPGSTYE